MATVTNVKPSYAKAGDSAISIIGTGFQDIPNLSKVYHRKHGQSAWEDVDPSRVTYVSATELTVAIDAANTDGWDKGLNDVGVSDSGETTPDGYIAQALFFYEAGLNNPNNVIKGAPEAIYVEGLFMGHSHGGASAEHGVETSEVEVDQSLFPVRQIKTGESFSLTVNLAEVTLENIKEVWGIQADIQDLGGGRRRLTFGGDQAITEKPVMLILPGGSGKMFALILYRCAVVSSGTFSWTRDDQVDLPLQLTALADTSRAAGDQVGRWEEYSA